MRRKPVKRLSFMATVVCFDCWHEQKDEDFLDRIERENRERDEKGEGT